MSKKLTKEKLRIQFELEEQRGQFLVKQKGLSDELNRWGDRIRFGFFILKCRGALRSGVLLGRLLTR